MWVPKINIKDDKKRSILFVPAMLDMHFPLIKYAFYSKNYIPVIMTEEDGITDLGIRYVNNDMCYPIIQIVGQMIKTLQSGKYNVNRVKLLMPTAGDACRGANYIGALRRAVKLAGYCNVPVLTLNVRDCEKDSMMKFDLPMVWRALFGLFYGDILMMLHYQTRPYEKTKGEADSCWEKWIKRLSYDMIRGRNLSLGAMRKNFRLISKDFAAIRENDTWHKIKRKPVVGIIGELYVKYCHLGNWDLVDFIEKNGAEAHVNGLSYYALYYMDTHMVRKHTLEAKGTKVLMKFLEMIQKDMIKAMKEYDFFTMPAYRQFKKDAHGKVNYNMRTGDGWLIGAEAVGYMKHGVNKVFAAQPFGCMVNHCAGRGLYPSLARKYKCANIVSADVDSSASKLNYYNRLLMLLNYDFRRGFLLSLAQGGAGDGR